MFLLLITCMLAKFKISLELHNLPAYLFESEKLVVSNFLCEYGHAMQGAYEGAHKYKPVFG